MILLDIDENQKCFILRGNLGPIMRKRRIKANFFSIGAQETADGQLSISYQNKDDRDKKYSEIQELLDKFGLGSTSKTKEAASVLRQIDEDNERFDIFAQKALDIRNNKHNTEEFRSFCKAIDGSFERKLSTLQLLSAYHLAFAQNACNFSVPGAGKTTVVYAAFSYLNSLDKNHNKHIDKILVIGPLASFYPWQDEYRKCFGVMPDVAELVKISKNDRSAYFAKIQKPLLTLISYQSAASSSQDIIHYLNRKNNRVMVVLDEAHRIKNTEGGKWASEILNMAICASSRVVLTGTPVPNGYEDLYNLYKFIWPTKNIVSLHEAKHITKNPDGHSTPEKIKDLISSISPFFIRVTKKDLSLPNPIENEPAIVPMDKKQASIYEYTAYKCLL